MSFLRHFVNLHLFESNLFVSINDSFNDTCQDFMQRNILQYNVKITWLHPEGIYIIDSTNLKEKLKKFYKNIFE
jgi:hypothetical protein